MALALQHTLGELRSEMITRLGFGAQGAAAGNIAVTVDSFLRNAQNYLYWKYEFNVLRKTYNWTAVAGQTLYDWPDDMEPRKAIGLRVLFNGIWQPMAEGIDYYHDTVVDTRYVPRRYDRRAQLEIWPQPDGTYTIRADYYQRLVRFTQDNDRCTMDDHLVFTLALGRAKRHYKHDDAQDYFNEITDLTRQLQLAAHGDKRYVVGEVVETPEPRPVVIDYI